MVFLNASLHVKFKFIYYKSNDEISYLKNYKINIDCPNDLLKRRTKPFNEINNIIFCEGH